MGRRLHCTVASGPERQGRPRTFFQRYLVGVGESVGAFAPHVNGADYGAGARFDNRNDDSERSSSPRNSGGIQRSGFSDSLTSYVDP